MCHILKAQLEKCSQKQFENLNFYFFHSACLLQNFVLFIIRHNNLGLSKTFHQMSLASLQSFVFAAPRI